jgi:hypothetical protein
VGHTGLVAQEGSEVAWLGGVILGELANAAPVVGGALAGKEPEGSVAGSFKLAVLNLIYFCLFIFFFFCFLECVV